MRFEGFPKTRPPLPPAYQAIFESYYRANRSGQTFFSAAAQWCEAWLHRQVARDATAQARTLEIGAGNLNHLPHEPQVRAYDIVEPFHALYADSAHKSRIGQAFDDIGEIGGEGVYDRIISVAVLEHICDLPDAVARAALLLQDGGTFRAGIPSEGGWLWHTAWRWSTGWEFERRYRMSFTPIMRHEHVNTAREIESVVQAFFARVTVRTRGIGLHGSLYRFIEAQEPQREKARQYLQQGA